MMYFYLWCLDRGSVFARLGHSTGGKRSTASSIRLRLGMTDSVSSPNVKSPRKRSRTCDNGLAIAVLQGLEADDDKLINRKVRNKPNLFLSLCLVSVSYHMCHIFLCHITMSRIYDSPFDIEQFLFC